MTGSRLGIDIGGTKMLLLEEREVGRRVEKIPTGEDFSVEFAEAVVRRFVGDCAEPPRSIGIAVPGLVDSQGRVVACGGLPQLEGWCPAEMDGLPSGVSVFNDVKAALVQEAASLDPGATAALVIVGTDVGAAFMIEGRPFGGAQGWAGELGSIPCGAGGSSTTLDRVAGGAAILRAAGATSAEFALRVERGEAEALRVIREAGAALGVGLATVINLFNPSVLVLGGGTLRWPGYFTAALSTTETFSLPELRAHCAIRESLYGDLLVALGVARAAARE